MNTITYSQRYLPHEFLTKYYAVKLYRTGVGVSFFCRRYHISKSSLMRWNKKFDGTKASLLDKSRKPFSKHPNAHTDEELKWIQDYHRRTPKISVCELYGKLRTAKGYTRHPGSVPQKFYQYTIIDEASRERFIFPYMEQSSYSTVVFLKRTILYFGYQPKIIQTDNVAEFTHVKKTNRRHPLDILCNQLKISHKLIRPRTPRHNGKVERSHRNDQERFYNHMSFYNYNDLLVQMKHYLNHSNNIPMQILDWKSPLEKRHELSINH